MTKKVFWDDPYQTELDTKVKTVDGNKITVAETIFYAFSGGQESDHGKMNGFAVLEATKVKSDIFYTLPDNHDLKIGSSVKMIIDWDRRYRLMKLHFAAEIVLELVCHKFLDIIKVGAHIAADKARVDFAWKENISPFLDSIQQQAQAIIDQDQEIISTFNDIKTERRYWKIKNFSQVPCGGTHVKRTSEIGKISLKRVNPGKGKERVEIYIS